MFVCRAVKPVVSAAGYYHSLAGYYHSLAGYYHSAGSVRVGAKLSQGDIWTLQNSSIVSGGRGANAACNVGLFSGLLQDKDVHCSWTACKPGSSLLGLLCFPLWRSKEGKMKNRLNAPESLFCLGAQTCFFHASEQKQVNWMKRKPVNEVKEVLLSKSSRGEGEKPEPEEKQKKTKQLKKVFQEYGAVGVSFHIGISLISLGIFYVAVSSGVNMAAVLCKLGFSESVVQSKMAAGTSTFVLAYAVHKLFAPFRISVTLVCVPLIVRYLRKTGLFKSLPPHL